MLEFLVYLVAGIGYGFYYDLNLLETVLVVSAIVLARRAWISQERIERVWRRLLRIALRPSFAVAAVFVLALAVRAVVLPVFPVPHPVITDEFSHLLLADTLAHGRLTNPTHPLWPHFESIHIIQRPTYNSDYFPGQAAVLAAGQLLGHPWIAVWLLSAAMCAALCWMLQAWVPPAWAVVGALLAIIRLDIGSYWVNGYYGGCLAALGGALALGAYPRLWRRGSWWTSLLFGSGIVAIGFTRPFEGLAVAIPALGALAVAIARKKARWWTAAPATAILLAGFACFLAYDQAVTGNVFRTPYAVNQAEYGWPMTLPWMHAAEAQFRHVELRRYYDYERDVHDRNATVLGLIKNSTLKAQEIWRFYFGPALSVPLILLPLVWRRGRLRFLLWIGVLTLLATLTEVGTSPHYAAAATGCFVAAEVACLRELCRRAWGVRYVAAVPAILLLVLAARAGLEQFHLPFTQRVNYQSWCCVHPGNPAKTQITAKLDQIGGRHLVLVRPKTDPDNVLQWIYNDADIDNSRIVWARDMGPRENAELLRYFHDRTSWVLDPNVTPPRIERWDPH
ncbi:MAG TPA: hypothetical protein VKX49_03955 [Bryobacteraceae bacterium]|nr:hypothetical protein [Bryobacteraceae bacterium]